METSRSPRRVLRLAYRLGRRWLPTHPCSRSRHDFTLPQLFACLVLREFFGLSYRRVEQLLRDSPHWLSDIGLTVAPDHNTLWRALAWIVRTRRINRALDLMAREFKAAGLLQLSRRPLALDSTCFEPRHRSKHYERRCRQMGEGGRSGHRDKLPNKPGKWGASVNASRRRQVLSMPKLSIAVACAVSRDPGGQGPHRQWFGRARL